MKELSLHILDISENSVNAGATRIEITVIENIKKDILTISVKDNGKGISAEKMEHIDDPFITSRTTRKVGLGIPFLKAAAEACQGGMQIRSKVGQGTEIEVTFQHSHIDRMPLGDLQATFLDLLIGYPQINWMFHYQVDDRVYTLDDQSLKAALEGVPLSEPAVIGYLKEEISNGFRTVMQENQ